MMPSIICGLSLHSLPPDGEGISLELWWPKGGGGASYWLGPLEERVCSTGGESGGDRPGGGREPGGVNYVVMDLTAVNLWVVMDLGPVNLLVVDLVVLNLLVVVVVMRCRVDQTF